MKTFKIQMTVQVAMMVMTSGGGACEVDEVKRIARHFENNPVFDHSVMFASLREDGGQPTGKLSVDAKRKRLIGLARSHDANQDDFLDKEELLSWVHEAYDILDYKEAMIELKAIDTDKDGTVTFGDVFKQNPDNVGEEEMETLAKKAKDGEELTNNEKELLKSFREDRKLYAAADVNQDGLLDESEFRAYHHPFTFPLTTDVELDNIMEHLGADKDGFLTQPQSNDSDKSQKGKELLEKLDLNQDGKLSRAEVKQYILEDQKEREFEEVKKLIKNTDDDKDEKLSMEEIARHEKQFLKNVATDFSKNLHYVRDEL